jgi:hypothetical protein
MLWEECGGGSKFPGPHRGGFCGAARVSGALAGSESPYTSICGVGAQERQLPTCSLVGCVRSAFRVFGALAIGENDSNYPFAAGVRGLQPTS